MEDRTVKLDEREIRYLLKFLADGREYYRLLAGNSNCTEENRQKHRLTEKLCAKLEANLL
jgi:hypothetical protein